MKTQIVIVITLTALFLFGSCNNNTIDDPKPIDIDLKCKELIQIDIRFGIDIFKLLAQPEDENLTISPLSISQALAMTYNGAEGETKIAMEKALRVNGLIPDEINQSYQRLVKALLEADPKVTIEIAQSIWYRTGFNVLNDFKTLNQTYYDAEVNELDFSRSDAKDVINGWVEEKTHDKIKDMIENIDPSYVMFLINAIYFNGEWKTQFETKSTQKEEFVQENGSSIEVDMMQKTDSVNYFSNEIFSAIEMPYGRGNYNMVVLLPNEGEKCSDILQMLTPENWSSWMRSFVMTEDVSIWLPKFKAEYEVKLNDVLSAMGMGIAFTPEADFSGINGTGNIYIDYVQHNTFIDVNEKGTEAAAATVVAIKWNAMPLSPAFHVNRPFIFAITEKETGAILFIGKMVAPSYE
jgi:serine protease inhibitor